MASNWIPNQHGAWAMLLSPLVVGAIAGGLRWTHLLLGAFWLVGYFAFFATSVWLKSRRRPRFVRAVQVYAAAATLLGLALGMTQPGLLVWAPLFAVPLGVGLWAASQRRERDLLAGLTTVLGSGLMTVVAYDVGSRVDGRAWQLALAQVLYFAGTVFYVKSAIRERDNPSFLAESTWFHLGAVFVVAWLSPALAAVFCVLMVRAATVPPLRLTPKTLGIGEIAATLAVATVSLLTI